MRLRGTALAHPIVTLAAVLAVAGVALAAVPAFRASEAPAFCATCHEMRPYYAAWQAGPHRGVDCVACHVDPGTASHLAHKVTAAKELAIHLAGDPKFPAPGVSVPDARCLACHAGIATARARGGFSHAAHAGQGACVTCHDGVGHKVAIGTLKAAGLLRPGVGLATSTPAPASGARGHAAVTCSRCHDLATTACAKCHAPPHDPRGDCATCHAASGGFAFVHPASRACATCHTAPARHFGSACVACHSPAIPFASATFRHTGSLACASCHRVTHRAYPATCASCHTRPGVSWAHTHPSSRACGSCHSAPGRHFGTACASCHRPGRAWASATFRHGAIAGSPHTYRSFACVSCHPRGYASHYCSCHGGGAPGD